MHYKVPFMTKFHFRDGSISCLPISLRYQNFDHKMSAIYNESRVTNTWRSINQCNEKLYFPGQPHRFRGSFQTFPYLWSSSRFFKAWKISTLNSMTFQTFPGSERTLSLGEPGLPGFCGFSSPHVPEEMTNRFFRCLPVTQPTVSNAVKGTQGIEPKQEDHPLGLSLSSSVTRILREVALPSDASTL